MNKIYLLIMFLVGILACPSQNLEFDIHKNKLADFIRIEDKAGGEKIKNTANHISREGIAQPVIYKRKQDQVPDLFVYYFYFEKDSTISYILYEWDDVNTKGYGERTKKTNDEVKSFITKYKEVCTQLSRLYGMPKTKGTLEDPSQNNHELKRDDLWTPNDSTSIELHTTLSGERSETASYSVMPTYRIRLYVTDVDTRSANKTFEKPDKKKFMSNDSIFRLFVHELKQKNTDAARIYLSDIIRSTVTQDQLSLLGKSVRFEEELIIFYTGVQIAGNGVAYLMIQYKYKSDSDSPPKDLIYVLFDDKGKIAGINPKKKY